ncbi:hypothetical protein QVD17_21885 [Tagetes erecta]|uniref:Uncharacterized protein n=1 Tax=Tagetes erecta TaxID=13708 RepID=A0AAD8KFZ4_TARER|nr:hypothetical protein QVD17_21885 [Tagetes erecta]
MDKLASPQLSTPLRGLFPVVWVAFRKTNEWFKSQVYMCEQFATHFSFSTFIFSSQFTSPFFIICPNPPPSLSTPKQQQ